MLNSRVIYQAPQAVFFEDVRNNCILSKMQKVAIDSGLDVSDAEKRSWRNNAPKIRDLLEKSGVSDTYVTFEYMLPRSLKRIDCMIYGTGRDSKENIVHIELKQWTNESVHNTDIRANFDIDEDTNCGLQAMTGDEIRTVAHPSQQVRGYNDYLTGFVEILSTEEISLIGMAYCYNYRRHPDSGLIPVLYDRQFDKLQREYRTYSGDELDELADKIREVLMRGKGFSIFNKMMRSSIKPSKKLLDSVSGMLDGDVNSSFSLLEDQIVAKNVILDKIRELKKTGKKDIIIVHGGPGTGKTVIALNILASLAKLKYDVHYATKSASLINGIIYQLPRSHSAKKLISGLTEFNYTKCGESELDVLLIDEAHRIEQFYTEGFGRNKKYLRDMTQIDALLRVSKILVLFIDDKQAIRSAEIGSSDMIRDCARRNKANISEVTLRSQFRCNGSNNYLDWLDDILYNKNSRRNFNLEEYEFKIFDDPQSLYNELSVKNDPSNGTTARIMAGFCWDWSSDLNPDGTPIKDVRIGDFAMPWETHRNLKKVPEGYVKWYEWAYRPEGFKQVGCIYTAQGFEFDYAGVIIGPDLEYDKNSHMLITDVSESKDPMLNKARLSKNFDTYCRNIYRVLMSRGMKGTYVYCCDESVKEYLNNKLQVR